MVKIRSISHVWTALLLGVAIAGCGGETGGNDTGGGDSFSATISGRVTFPDGKPAREVQVSTRDVSVFTTSNGAFVLTGNREDDLLVTAELTVDGLRYIGQTLSRTYQGEQATNANIMIVPESETATLTGVVEDRNGAPLQNATVFAIANNGLSSTKAITNKFGEYTMRYLLSNVLYTVNAGGQGYRSDSDTVTLRTGETRSFAFSLSNPDGDALPAPTNLSAIAWTSPITRDRAMIRAIDAVKNEFDPKRAARRQATRLSPNGNPLEIEIQWDDTDSNEKLGFGIYRGIAGAAPTAIDYFRDPLARVYVDSDTQLRIDTNYQYRVTTLNTLYPDASGSESAKSDQVEANPLDDLTLRTFDDTTTTIQWNHVAGAENYVVYVYEAYPDYGVRPLWETENARTTANEQRYNGQALTRGHTYYYLVMALADNDSARSLSEVGSFTY